MKLIVLVAVTSFLSTYGLNAQQNGDPDSSSVTRIMPLDTAYFQTYSVDGSHGYFMGVKKLASPETMPCRRPEPIDPDMCINPLDSSENKLKIRHVYPFMKRQ